MSGCKLAKACLGLSVATAIIYAISFASPYWIQKDFSLDMPGFMLGLPFPLNATVIPVSVRSHMGLLTACGEISVSIPGLPPRKNTDCDSDGAKDWQYVAAICGCTGLVISVLSIGLSTSIVFLDRRPFYNKLRVTTVVSYLLTCISILIAIILYVSKREFQVRPPLPNKEVFDLHWAIWVAVGSDVLFGILTALHLAHIFMVPSSQGSQKDPSSTYTMDNKGFG